MNEEVMQTLASAMYKVQQEGGLPMWTIYDAPKDYPQGFVARMFIYDKPTATAVAAHDLAPLRGAMEQLGLTRLARDPSDHETVVETWI